MWAEAYAMLKQAEQLHRQFFEPSREGRGPRDDDRQEPQDAAIASKAKAGQELQPFLFLVRSVGPQMT
jgi:hypothetical protein